MGIGQSRSVVLQPNQDFQVVEIPNGKIIIARDGGKINVSILHNGNHTDVSFENGQFREMISDRVGIESWSRNDGTIHVNVFPQDHYFETERNVSVDFSPDDRETINVGENLRIQNYPNETGNDVEEEDRASRNRERNGASNSRGRSHSRRRSNSRRRSR